MRHEIVVRNPDIEVRFYLSEDEGSYVTSHWHESIEMVYMLEGKITVGIENRRMILNPGEFNIINSRTVHEVLSEKNKALVLQVPKEMIKKQVPSFDDYYFEVDMHPKSEVEITRLERMKKIFMDMYITYDVRPDGYLLKFNSLLYDLLYMLIHSYSKKTDQKNLVNSGKHLEQLDRLMAFLKEHYREKVSLKDIAGEFGYNEDYLTRFFKKWTGMTIMEFLNVYRVTRVYQDVVGTDKSINEIFTEHGCNNPRVTMRIFKQIYNCTPREIRKKERGTIPD